MSLKNLESRIKLPEQWNQEIDIDKLQKKCLIDYTTMEPKPEISIELKQAQNTYRLCTYKNFSVLGGKQKSRKTFLCSLLMAGAVRSDSFMDFRGYCKDRINIVFDTEQGRYDAAIANSRIIKLCGYKSQPGNLKTYSLRALTVTERIEFIDYTIQNMEHIGFVIIDGIRDLVTSINDEQQATEISTMLMQWTEEKNCHIMVVLHLNKGEFSELRGHLGTELQNKAETIIEIEKNKDNPQLSMVKARNMRAMEFNPFFMGINEKYLPYIDNQTIPDLEF